MHHGSFYHTAIWTGSKMIIWGGYNGNYLSTGATYYPVSDTWITITNSSAPAARDLHTAIWTGNKMIFGAVGTAAVI